MYNIPVWIIVIYFMYSVTLFVMSIITWVRISKPNSYTLSSESFSYKGIIVNENSQVSITNSLLLMNTATGRFFVMLFVVGLLGFVPLLIYSILWFFTPHLLKEEYEKDHTKIEEEHEMKHVIDSQGRLVFIP